MTAKRTRGRPRGTGKNDEPFLNAVADLLIVTPGLKPTTAMKQVLNKRSDWSGASFEAALRRLQEKWKGSAETYLANARARLAAVTVRPRASSATFSDIGGAFRDLNSHLSIWKSVQDILDPPYLRQIREQLEFHRRIEEQLFPLGREWERLQEAMRISDLTKQAMEQVDPIGTAMKRATGSW